MEWRSGEQICEEPEVSKGARENRTRKPMARKGSRQKKDEERAQIKLLKSNGRPERESRTCMWKTEIAKR